MRQDSYTYLASVPDVCMFALSSILSSSWLCFFRDLTSAYYLSYTTLLQVGFSHWVALTGHGKERTGVGEKPEYLFPFSLLRVAVMSRALHISLCLSFFYWAFSFLWSHFHLGPPLHGSPLLQNSSSCLDCLSDIMYYKLPSSLGNPIFWDQLE